MRLHLLAAALAVFTFAFAQGGLPQCSIPCVNSAISSTGCKGVDVLCFCQANSFHETIAPCIAGACDDKDQDKTEQFARGICGAVGVDLPSFHELLANSKATSSNATVVGTSMSTPTANQTINSANGTTSRNSTVTATNVTIPGESAGATRAQTQSLGVRSDYGYAATLLAVASVLGMLLA